MPIVAAAQLLTAIECGELTAKPIAIGEQFEVTILVGGCEVARVGCLKIERPTAKLTHDSRSVDVFPSPGMPDGFSINCDSREEAILIVEALEQCFESAHLILVGDEPTRV